MKENKYKTYIIIDLEIPWILPQYLFMKLLTVHYRHSYGIKCSDLGIPACIGDAYIHVLLKA